MIELAETSARLLVRALNPSLPHEGIRRVDRSFATLRFTSEMVTSPRTRSAHARYVLDRGSALISCASRAADADGNRRVQSNRKNPAEGSACGGAGCGNRRVRAASSGALRAQNGRA